jgi:APA family basic amino acid/polyamine antiporter
VSSVQSRHGLPTLVALVVAGMIGSGVFTTSGYALESLGSPGFVLAAWAVGGGIAVCGAIAYGALVARLPESGGEYVYLARAVHPFAGFLAGIVSLTAGFSGAMALAALTCERYLPLPLPPWLPPRTFATAVILVCGLAHATAGRFAVGVNTVIVALKMVVIAVLVIAGEVIIAGREPVAVATGPLPAAGAFAAAVMWIMFSYIGFNQAVYIAAEADDPARTVPRALVIGTLVTTAAYLLLNHVVLHAAPYGALAGQADVAAVAARALAGTTFETALRWVITLATFTSVAGMTMTGPRVTACMAADGVFPRWYTGPVGLRRAVLLHMVLALALIHEATILGLLGYLGITLSLFSALTVATLWLPATSRARMHAEAGPSATPRAAARLAAAVYVAATLGFIALLARHDPWQLAGTAATLLGGGLTWLLIGRAARARDAAAPAAPP